MSAVVSDRMTIAEFDALPDDPETDRELVFGELVERPMTVRNRRHAGAEASVVAVLRQWLQSAANVSGKVFSGEVGCDLPDVESRVGIDVAYFDQEVIDKCPPDSPYLVGPPVVAAEILSPSDRVDEINRKIKVYLESGVQFVWIVDPDLKTLTIHRPSARPQLLAGDQEFSGESELPGLRFAIEELFS